MKIKDPTAAELDELAARRAAREHLARLREGNTSFVDVVAAAQAANNASANAVWQRKLNKRNGKRIANAENFRLWLELCPAMQGATGYDEFLCRVMVAGSIPKEPNLAPTRGSWRTVQDRDYTAIQELCQRSGLEKISRDIVINGIQKHAYGFPFHPVRNYLEGLKWDGADRLQSFFISCYGARGQGEEDDAPLTEADGRYMAAVAKAIFCGAVARIYKPGDKVDTVPVLEGRQGVSKSEAVGLLFKPWFSENLPADLGSKDAMSALAGVWGVELSELPQARKDVDTVKAFLSRRVDRYRPAYAREEIEQPRQCVFLATTNEEHYLKDTTGNRRFLPVKVGQANLDLIKLLRDQLWAQAVVLYRRGGWWVEGEMERYASEVASARVAPDPWRDIVLATLENSFLPDPFSPGELLQQMGLDITQRTPQAAVRVATILRQIGCRKLKRDRTRGMLYQKPKYMSRETNDLQVQS